jgi:tetratricopeptide (TPR) repeat protein
MLHFALRKSVPALTLGQPMFGKLAGVFLALATAALADRAADDQIENGIREFSAAFRKWDGDGFSRAAEIFRQASVSDPGSAAASYWRGTALFHRMLSANHTPDGKPDAKVADAAAAEAERAFEAALAIDPDHAESHALLGTLYGMKIKGSLVAGIRYGPRVQEHQKKALASGATNPRVRYLLGVGQMHTAKNDAGYREALATLLASEKLFTHESKRPAGPLAPRWGHSSCLAFIGKVYEAMGKSAEAVAYYRKALAMHPADHAAADGIGRLAGK